MAQRWPQHGPKIAQVDPDMDAENRQHGKGSVEWYKHLEECGLKLMFGEEVAIALVATNPEKTDSTAKPVHNF
jgi:hypothetical protein